MPQQSPVDGTERDRELERLSRGMSLLLAARDRVLTLSEQRVSHTPIVRSNPIPITFLDPRAPHTIIDLDADSHVD